MQFYTMQNITLIKLRLKKAFRNLQDYLKISYLTGAIDGDDLRYSSIWEDYIISKKSLEEIDKEFFAALDTIEIPKLFEATSFRGSTKYMGFPAQSRNTIKAAIENALEYIATYEANNSTQTENINDTTESTDLIIR